MIQRQWLHFFYFLRVVGWTNFRATVSNGLADHDGLGYACKLQLVDYRTIFCILNCILYFEISTYPGLLKTRHSHRFGAVVMQILIPKIKDVCIDFEPYFKVHNLVSVHP